MNKKPSANFIVLGSPASGKGTICKILSNRTNSPVVAPGEIYRQLREQNTELGKLVKESLKGGGICPNHLTNQIVYDESVILTNSGFRGVVLDGYPRSVEQLDFLQEKYDCGFYLHLDAPYEKLLKASVNRRKCPVCDSVFSLLRENSFCGCVPESKWITRWDDSAEFFEKRYKTYLEITSPIIERVKYLKNYKKINILDIEPSKIDVSELINAL